MARKRKQGRRDIVTIIGFIFIIFAIAVAQYGLGIEVVEWLPDLEEDSSDTSKEPETIASDELGRVVAVGNYTVHFNQPINTDDWSRHEGSPIEESMVNFINSAQSTIDGALFELNLESVTNALIDAHKRGVQVRLVVDDEHAAEDEESTVDQLEEAGIPIVDDNRTSLMHHKFLIVDSSQVWMGSMNFTHNGVYNNNNNALIIRSSRLAQNYQAEFNEMFTEKVFNRRDDDDQASDTRRELTVDGVMIETYFSPEDGDAIEDRVAELIREADQSVKVMVFSFTLDLWAEALVNRHNNGINVQVVVETVGSTGTGAELPRLLCEGIPARRDGNPDILHHKVIIIDEEIIVTGSFNFSVSARDNNSENLLIIHSANLARYYINEFDQLYNDQRTEVPALEC